MVTVNISGMGNHLEHKRAISFNFCPLRQKEVNISAYLTQWHIFILTYFVFMQILFIYEIYSGPFMFSYNDNHKLCERQSDRGKDFNSYPGGRFMMQPCPFVYPALLHNHFYPAVKNN